MNRRSFLFNYFISLLVIGLLNGCSSLRENPLPGYVIRYTKSPYTRDLDNTPLGDIEQEGKIIRITEPFTGYGIYTELMTNAIGDIAEKHGLTEIYFADIEELNILGIWKHNKLYIYGK